MTTEDLDAEFLDLDTPLERHGWRQAVKHIKMLMEKQGKIEAAMELAEHDERINSRGFIDNRRKRQ